ncbi:flavodoxin domain-containing protein [Nocardia gipuzkoensis]|uniref:flavodoxin family protein n=1 Tax=Nocardia gipuzkoensis TaxID=2749991 RepID=UPI001E5D0E56|nr:flavodoxin domain-containing protein [Nocardia gipuzkoensis]UGT67777.1 flavodoxin domain-containing protein [Nocardia gipuzkoensis]
MLARVVYESMFGNTAAVARAIAQGLDGYGTVEVLDVATAADAAAPQVDLLIVGAPTHAFGLSRQRTRRDAAKRTTAPVAVDIGVREWLDAAFAAPTGSRAAAFGTKAATPSWLPGSAARGVARRLRRAGYELATDPMDFLVTDVTGPLVGGELERARTWAERLAAAELQRVASRP